MSTAEQVLQRVTSAGGVVDLEGERIRCRLPEDARTLVEDLRIHKGELLALRRRRNEAPPMPSGVRLIDWNPKQPPVCLENLFDRHGHKEICSKHSWPD